MKYPFTLLAYACVCLMASCGMPDENSGGRINGPTPGQTWNGERSSSAATQPPRLKADAFCLVDVDSGRVLASHRGWESRPVASTQKLLTALVVLEAGDLYRDVTIAPADLDIYGSMLGLQVGEVINRYELLKALLIASANDAALALARDVAGSTKAFAQQMDQKAEQVGATRSHFINPHGLTQGGQSSNAKDMAIIAMAVYAQPTLRQLFSLTETTVQSSTGSRTIRNTNDLLGKLPGCTGMKTGFTPGAGICLVSSYEANGRRLILVQLDSTRADVYNDAARALWWGSHQ